MDLGYEKAENRKPVPEGGGDEEMKKPKTEGLLVKKW